MKAVIGIRGERHHLERFIEELGAQYLPFKIYDEKQKKLVDRVMHIGVQPLQLYAINFPEEHKDLVLNTLFDGHEKGQHGWYKKMLFLLRKFLHLEPIPKYDRSTHLPVWRHALEVLGIGILKDYWINPDGTTTFDKSKAQEGAYEGI